MNKSLVTKKDLPTHKFVTKVDGDWNTFYLTQAQADKIAANINSPAWYIVLSKNIDPNAPRCYPKGKDTYIEPLNKEEKEKMYKKYMYSAEDVKKEEEDKKSEENRKKVREWINLNPEEFKKIQERVRNDLINDRLYNSTSERTRDAMVKCKARIFISNTILPSLNKQHELF